MEILSENQEYAISKFLKRYDYDAVLEILEEAGIIDGDLYFLIEGIVLGRDSLFLMVFLFRSLELEL